MLKSSRYCIFCKNNEEIIKYVDAAIRRAKLICDTSGEFNIDIVNKTTCCEEKWYVFDILIDSQILSNMLMTMQFDFIRNGLPFDNENLKVKKVKVA